MKKIVTAFLLLTLAVPLEAAAMTQIILGPHTGITNSATRFMGFHTGNTTSATVIGAGEVPAAVGGVASGLVARMTVAPGAGQSATITLLVNGSPTSLSCAVTDTNTSCSNTVDTVTIAEGDLVAWRNVTTATSGGNIIVTAQFTPTSDGESLIQAQSNGVTINNATHYMPMSGGLATTTEIHASSTMPVSGVVDKLYMRLNGSPGTGTSYTYDLMKNGNTTGVDCTISGTNVACSDTTDSVSYVAGDSIYIRVTITSGSPQVRNPKWSVRLRPTVNGESALFLMHDFFSNVTRYDNLTGSNRRFTTEADSQATTTVGWVAKNLYYVNIYGQPTGAQTRTMTLKENGASTGISATINSSTTWSTDLVNQATIEAGNLFNYEATVSGSPPTTALYYVSLVSYIAPPAPSFTPGQYRAYNLGTMLLNMGSLIFR